MSDPPVSEPEKNATKRRAPLVELGIGAAWLLGLSALLTIGDGFLGQVPIARAILGGLVASIAAGRAGIVWDENDPESDSPKRALRGLGLGIALAASACLAAILVAHFAGWASVKPGHPGLMLALSVVAGAGAAVREEVVLRAIPIHFAKRTGIGAAWATGFAALLTPASFLLSTATTPASVALAIASGWLAARLLWKTGSLWAAIGANVACSLLTGPLLHGGLFDVSWTNGELAHGALGWGPPAALGAVLLGLAALAVGRGPFRLDREPASALPRSPRSRRR
jgi:hypothetical protein